MANSNFEVGSMLAGVSLLAAFLVVSGVVLA